MIFLFRECRIESTFALQVSGTFSKRLYNIPFCAINKILVWKHETLKVPKTNDIDLKLLSKIMIKYKKEPDLNAK